VRTQIQDLTQTIFLLSGAGDIPPRPSSAFSPSSNMSHRSSPNALATALKFAATMKKFDQNLEPDKFWIYFEAQCSNNGVNDDIAGLLLSNLVASHPSGPQWFSSYVSVMTNPTLSQMKSSFARYFITDEIKSRRHQQLLELRYRQGETVRSFSNRFIEALTLNGIKVGASQTDYAYVKEIYFFKLPASVRRYHGTKFAK